MDAFPDDPSNGTEDAGKKERRISPGRAKQCRAKQKLCLFLFSFVFFI